MFKHLYTYSKSLRQICICTVKLNDPQFIPHVQQLDVFTLISLMNDDVHSTGSKYSLAIVKMTMKNLTTNMLEVTKFK